MVHHKHRLVIVLLVIIGNEIGVAKLMLLFGKFFFENFLETSGSLLIC